jgi:hypothetical protein
VEASRNGTAISLATKAEVAVSVVESARKRKADDRVAEELLESERKEELAALSEQEVEELEVLLDGGQGERLWPIHARAPRKRHREECAAGERLNHWQRRWRDGGQREATAMKDATPAMTIMEAMNAMRAQTAMPTAAIIFAMTAVVKNTTAMLAMIAMTASHAMNAMAQTLAAMATLLALICARGAIMQTIWNSKVHHCR